MSKEKQEVRFLTVLEELIETYSKVGTLPSNSNITLDSLDALEENVVNQPESAATVISLPQNNPRLEYKFDIFMKQLEETKFHLEIIPYDRITECVFEKTPTEILDRFTKELRLRGEKYFSEPENIQESIEITFLKIMRHIDLALIQKSIFITTQWKEMDDLKKDYRLLNDRYTSLKDEADTQYRSMLTQFISILGIFAAILMGAFGAIQGFTSLFSNAYQLSTGKLLIISSIGASSVILILFFLLNGIAKLTERSLSSTNKIDGSLLEKHPSLVIVHGILIFISLIGASLELSNVHLQFAAQGFWWILPIIWISYIIFAIQKKNYLFFINWIKNKDSDQSA